MQQPAYWNEYKTKNENKYRTGHYRYFLESNFVGVTRLLSLIYSNVANDIKRYSTKTCYSPKGITKLITSSSLEITFMTKPLFLL